MSGHYFYSDYCSGWLKDFVYRNGQASSPITWPVANSGPVQSFGHDSRRELYFAEQRRGQGVPH